jgi:purine-binding chemotaxis protein CheW
MDSSEIHKKAKIQTRTDELVTVPGTQQDPDRDVGPDSPEQRQVENAAEAYTALAVLEDNAAAMQRANEGIDRLFSSTDDFPLAMGEFYMESLDNQVGSQAQTNRRYLAFQLGNEEYALDIKRISEIIKVRELTGIPRTPEFLLGIVSLRGVVVPVFDLRRRLHLGVSATMPTSRIVICQLDDATVGLLVDSINQVVNLSDDEIEPPPEVLDGREREMVSGIGRYQGRMIIILNVHNALNGRLY